jgi:hypothetical protein
VDYRKHRIADNDRKRIYQYSVGNKETAADEIDNTEFANVLHDQRCENDQRSQIAYAFDKCEIFLHCSNVSPKRLDYKVFF